MFWRGDEQRRIARRLDQQARSGLLRHRWEAEALQPPGPLERLVRALLRRPRSGKKPPG